jgi:hypothetical protein
MLLATANNIIFAMRYKKFIEAVITEVYMKYKVWKTGLSELFNFESNQRFVIGDYIADHEIHRRISKIVHEFRDDGKNGHELIYTILYVE